MKLNHKRPSINDIDEKTQKKLTKKNVDDKIKEMRDERVAKALGGKL